MQSRELAVLAAECAAADGAFHCSGGVPLQPARAGWRRLRCVAGSGVGLADGCVAGFRQKGGWVVSMCGSKGWCQQGARRAAGRRESQCRGRPGWWRPCRGGRHTEQQRAPVSRAAGAPEMAASGAGQGSAQTRCGWAWSEAQAGSWARPPPGLPAAAQEKAATARRCWAHQVVPASVDRK